MSEGTSKSTPPSSDDSERRAATRHITCTPFHVQRGERGQSSNVEIALIQDLSPTGALLLSVGDLPVGTRVKLHLDLGDSPARIVEARVVRAERRPEDVSDVWRFAAAVHFAEAQQDLEPFMRELETRVSKSM